MNSDDREQRNPFASDYQREAQTSEKQTAGEQANAGQARDGQASEAFDVGETDAQQDSLTGQLPEANTEFWQDLAAAEANLASEADTDGFDPDSDWNGDDRDEPTFSESWPVGLVAVAVIALVLLAAGGYGVMQQRAGMQQELQALQAELALAGGPENAARQREKLRELQQRNARLDATLADLRLENRQLSDTIAGLESQLEPLPGEVDAEETEGVSPSDPVSASPLTSPQKTQIARREPPPESSSPRAPPDQPASAAPAAAAIAGAWFVNFGSYSREAMARQWSQRLQPGSGEVVVAAAESAGVKVFRVRIVKLSSRGEAEAVARNLERQYGLAKLWVGRQ